MDHLVSFELYGFVFVAQNEGLKKISQGPFSGCSESFEFIAQSSSADEFAKFSQTCRCSKLNFMSTLKTSCK